MAGAFTEINSLRDTLSFTPKKWADSSRRICSMYYKLDYIK
jgi:hypothetical protein